MRRLGFREFWRTGAEPAWVRAARHRPADCRVRIYRRMVAVRRRLKGANRGE